MAIYMNTLSKMKRKFGYIINKLRLRIASSESIFSHYHKSNFWGDSESVSGGGSTKAYTENIREEIPALLERLGVKVFLDAPCGDFNWFKDVCLPENVKYVGADIVPDLIEDNKARHSSKLVDFLVLDITKDNLPLADMWMCRDCLFHLSNRDVERVIENYKKSNIRYLLTSIHPETDENKDIKTGDFRFINLELAPFSFPKPILMIDDWIEGFPKRYLALWERSQFE